ncbi:MAG: NADH-quinone oxidoreductase subunit N [Thermoanaerobaculum sp.]|nr:NADH-quinone oxidoreductase subunit N [Thermoanaerobaculum sp.]
MNAQLSVLLPELILAGLGMVLLLVGVTRRASPSWAFSLANLGLVAAAVAVFVVGERGQTTFFSGMVQLDRFALFFRLLFLFAALLVVWLSRDFLRRAQQNPWEYYALVLFATLGMSFLASGVHLAGLYVSLELMALSSYILAGYFRGEVKSHEAATKYFVLGALSSGVLVYGLSLLYGATGSLDLVELRQILAQQPPSMAAMAGVFLLLAGMLFKVAAVPFHVWTPDVYEGAPTPMTAFFSVGPKAAAFAMMVRVFWVGLAPAAEDWRVFLAWIAAATMVWGNVAALTQDNVKRLLAYSSIAHAGYALLGVVAGGQLGIQAVLFYMLVYALTNLGAFGLVVLLGSKEYAGEKVSDFRGMGRKHPLAAFAMLLFLLSLGGIPPTAGFMGKLYLFAAAVHAGFAWLAVVGVVMSAVSLYYYFRIVREMYLPTEEEEEPLPVLSEAWGVRALAVCAFLTLLFGVYPTSVLAFTAPAAMIAPW